MGICSDDDFVMARRRRARDKHVNGHWMCVFSEESWKVQLNGKSRKGWERSDAGGEEKRAGEDRFFQFRFLKWIISANTLTESDLLAAKSRVL